MKYIRYIVLSFIMFFIFTINTSASTNTYTRTSENLIVPSDVVVDSNNINNILKTPSVSSSEKLYDFADLLTDSEEEKLVKRINKYVNSSTIDVAIVTTNDLLGFSIDDYAYNFYDYNDFMNDGIVFVIYTGGNEPEIYMGNSGDTEGKVFTIYTDYWINQILDYVYKDIKVGKYYSACNKYVDSLDALVDVERNGNYRMDGNGNLIKNIPWVEIVVLSLTLTFIIIVIIYSKAMSMKKLSYADRLDDCVDKSNLMVKNNSYTNTYINK